MKTEQQNDLFIDKALAALRILNSDSIFECKTVRFTYKMGFPSLTGEMVCRRNDEWYLIEGKRELYLGRYPDKFKGDTTFLLKFSNPSDKMEYINDFKNLSYAIDYGKMNPLYCLDSVHSVDEDREEGDLLWKRQ